MIQEVGIFFNGILLINREYNSPEENQSDKFLIFSLISALETFFRTIFSQELEYIKGERSVLIISKEIIKSPESNHVYRLIAYVIIDNDIRGIDNYIKRIITPRLGELLNQFRNQYPDLNFNNVNKYSNFEKKIDKIFKY
ncbi:MAG: hypothetical protein ACFFCV_07060 [Promethearchaeota archaeon]